MIERLPVRLRSRIDTTSQPGCWLWTGRLDRNGYATQVRVGDRRPVAHRAVWLLLRGPLSDQLQLDHVLCPHRHCVNPAHLEAVTQAENIERSRVGAVGRAQTECRRGHPFSGANLVTMRRGRRTERGCRTCRNAAALRYLRRQRPIDTGNPVR